MSANCGFVYLFAMPYCDFILLPFSKMVVVNLRKLDSRHLPKLNRVDSISPAPEDIDRSTGELQTIGTNMASIVKLLSFGAVIVMLALIIVPTLMYFIPLFIVFIAPMIPFLMSLLLEMAILGAAYGFACIMTYFAVRKPMYWYLKKDPKKKELNEGEFQDRLTYMLSAIALQVLFMACVIPVNIIASDFYQNSRPYNWVNKTKIMLDICRQSWMAIGMPELWTLNLHFEIDFSTLVDTSYSLGVIALIIDVLADFVIQPAMSYGLKIFMLWWAGRRYKKYLKNRNIS